MKKFDSPVDHSFGYTPDTAYFTLDGMFRQGLKKEATELTLNHLANYNFHKEWNIPVAPEAYREISTYLGTSTPTLMQVKSCSIWRVSPDSKYSLPNKKADDPTCATPSVGLDGSSPSNR